MANHFHRSSQKLTIISNLPLSDPLALILPQIQVEDKK